MTVLMEKVNRKNNYREMVACLLFSKGGFVDYLSISILYWLSIQVFHYHKIPSSILVLSFSEYQCQIEQLLKTLLDAQKKQLLLYLLHLLELLLI